VTATLGKLQVRYRRAGAGAGRPRCGTCAMFHPRLGTCDLVRGRIAAGAVCSQWIPRGKR